MSASFHKNFGNCTFVVSILAFDSNSITPEHRKAVRVSVGRKQMGEKDILAAVKERRWKAVRYRLAEYMIACIELGFVTSLQQLSWSLF
jgi:hypothetical protein